MLGKQAKHMSKHLRILLWLAGAWLFSGWSLSAAQQPNFIVILADDLGYQDLGCFGSPLIKTPALDRMAQEGMKFTSFYAQAVCGPSRAAFLSGSYPIRVGEPSNRKLQHTVLHPKETTIAEVLKTAGYATACIGKWHQGEKKSGTATGWDPATMPNAQGFDYFYGTPLYNGFTVEVGDTPFRSQLLRNETVVQDKVESWDNITQDYTREAVQFIREHKGNPFFLYLAHNMPHIPLGASERFKGKSKGGPFGDAVEEMDWSTGEILKTLKQLGLDENTLVVFTSDNGPWVETTRGMDPKGKAFIPRNHSGHADPLRGYKMLTWDGGLRVPCVMRWPGKIPAGKVTKEIASTMDLLPTFAALSGAKLPEVTLDGRDIRALISDEAEAKSPHEAIYYYSYTHLQAVRSGPWKLVRPRPEFPKWTGFSGRFHGDGVKETELYQIEEDPGESHNVASAHPEIVARLQKLVEQGRRELGDYDLIGTGARFFETAPKRPEVKEFTKPVLAKQAANESDIYKPQEPLGGLRFDFENGDLQGWRVVEGKFAALINSREQFHHQFNKAAYNKQGKWFLTTLEPEKGDRGDDAQTGVVESPVFTVEGNKASFLVGGGKHLETYVALVDAQSGGVLKRASGNNAEVMQRVNWDLTGLKGKKVFLRVVDAHKGSWGHVTLDDFSVAGSIDTAATQKRWALLAAAPKEATAPAWVPPKSDITHSFIAFGAETYIMSAEGKVVWTYPANTRDGWVLPNGNVLMAVSKGKEYPGGAVVEVKRDGTKVFEFKGSQAEVNTVEQLDNGNLLLTEAGPKPRLLEVNRQGEIKVEFPIQCQLTNFHMQSRMSRKLPNGNYLVPQLLDKVVREYDKTGKIVWEVKTPNWPFTAIRLANGNTVINCTYGNMSIEVDPQGKTVWQLTNDDLPAPLIKDACGGQRLPNGNTVITSYGSRGKGVKLTEVTPGKKIVWTYEDEKNHGIHHFQILDTNGTPLAGKPMK